jgi:hypothetical protein
MLAVLLLLLSWVCVGLFAFLNWTLFTNVTELSLGLTTVYAPLGVVMLGVVAGMGLILLGWVIASQAKMLLEKRRHLKELNTHRELVEQAESSRFTKLHDMFGVQLAQLSQSHNEMRNAVAHKLQESTNTVCAQLDQLQDRLERNTEKGPAFLGLGSLGPHHS